jgi:Fe-Mn family superoxide dismutase
MKIKNLAIISCLSLLLFSCGNQQDAQKEKSDSRDAQTEKKSKSPEPIVIEGAFQLPNLGYAYDALEPHIDAKTMEIHYGKHHAGYTRNLNNAIKGSPKESQSIEVILKELDMNNTTLRNNAGGYYNHNLFWEIMSPDGGGEPNGELAEAINESFGGFEEFKDVFSKAAASQFGSGWAWLNIGEDGKLSVCGTANQDTPIMPGLTCKGTPIMGIDVWEHAYYLNYQNRRPDYINAFFEVVDWNVVNQKYLENKS